MIHSPERYHLQKLPSKSLKNKEQSMRRENKKRATVRLQHTSWPKENLEIQRKTPSLHPCHNVLATLQPDLMNR